MTEYYYEDEVEDEPPAPPPARRIRFDPTRERGAEYFVRAHRHSRLVRWLKFGLPLTAAAAVVGFVLVVQFSSDDSDTGGVPAVVTLSGINVESKSLIMEKPNISGFEGTRHAYEVKAIQAIQDLDNPKVITLKEIAARIGIGAGATAMIDAASGVFDSTTKLLVLKGGITLVTTNGYKATFKDARVDLGKGDLASDEPVEISGAEGTINANSIKVVDRGARVTFGGGVHLVLTPDNKPDPVAAPAKAGTAAAGTAPAADAPKPAADGNS